MQAGIKALIPSFKVETNKGVVYFATYVSRGEVETPTASECIQDYQDLKNLSRKARDRLTYTASQDYNVVDPITSGLCQVGGKTYPWFTMPFVANRAELSVSCQTTYEHNGIERTTHTVPYFKFAVDADKHMQEFNKRMTLIAMGITEGLNTVGWDIAAIRRYMGILLMPAIKQTPDTLLMSQQGFRLGKQPPKIGEFFNIVAKQYRDLLVGNALLYLLSDGHFPKEHNLSAGDWMVRPKSSGGFEMTLITVRGGWENVGSDEKWVQRMRDCLVTTTDATGNIFPLFFILPDEFIRECLIQAKLLVKKK